VYLQITTRCNMLCAHCCFSSTAEGEDMPFEVFKAAIRWDDSQVTLGGGEPTLHPEFWKILAYAVSQSDYVWLATNGSRTDDAIALARLASSDGVLSCALSRTQFHDKIDPRVEREFKHRKLEVRGDLTIPVLAGRWTDTDICRDECACDSRFVKPNGDIMLCGCPSAPVIGTVWDYHPDRKFDDVECVRNIVLGPHEVYLAGDTLHVHHKHDGPYARLGKYLAEFFFKGQSIKDCSFERFQEELAEYGVPIEERFRPRWAQPSTEGVIT
jgi:hypothetical protein